MCEPVTLGLAAASAGMAIAGGIAKGNAEKNAGNAALSAAQQNKLAADRAADDALVRGEFEAGKVQAKAEQMVGEQRVGYASQGVVVDQGTALQTQVDTAGMAAIDMETVRSNARREAWGLRVQGINFLNEGIRSKNAADSAATASIIGGAAQAAGTLGSGLAQSGAFASAPVAPGKPALNRYR